MNKELTSSHAENGYVGNGLEQAALLKAHIAIARVKQMERLVPTDGRALSPRERWYAALELGLIDWIARGGFALDGEPRELAAEQT